MLTALSTTALTSCGSDDDDDNNNNNNGGGGSSVTGNNSSLVKDGNILLTSITNSRKQETYTYTFAYDELLRPISAKTTYSFNEVEDVMFTIDYNTGKILYNNIGYVSVSFNSNGYINKIQGSWNGGSQLTTASYDNNGHVIGIERVHESYEEDGNYEKKVSKSILTWENGNLTKRETNSIWSGKIQGSEKYTETFTYSNIPNKYKQFCFVYAYGKTDTEMIMTGLYGVGPNMLPQTEHSLGISEGHKETYESNWRLEFTQNENGTINTEKQIDSQDGHIRIDAQYHYTPANEYKASGTRAAVTRTGNTSMNKDKRIKKFMRKALFMPTGIH